MHARRFGASHCLAAAAYVFLIRTCQTAYGTVAHRRRDCFDRLEITVASRRKSRFYYIDPHAFEMTRDTQLFFLRHRRARALLAIAHGGIEYDQLFFFHDCLRTFFVHANRRAHGIKRSFRATFLPGRTTTSECM